MKQSMKLVSLMLVFAMLLSVAVFADETGVAVSGDVEIIFNVGDSVLSINGVKTEVEKPFVINGVTMVPLRVISEAFGAIVNWDDATQKITLAYDGVIIVLQIGNKQAIVNEKPSELNEAPTLSPGGRTMVPLRFISETFGATVDYDEKTEGIKVFKGTPSAGNEEDDTIKAALNKSYVGDSYFKWSMDTPKSMSVTERWFDGCKTVFQKPDDNNAVITIYVDKDTVEDNTLDKELKYGKELFKSTTIIRSEKVSQNGDMCALLQAKDSKDHMDMRIFLKNGFRYGIALVMDVTATNDKRKEYTSYLDSFRASFTPGTDIEDMSNVESGYRPFADKKYGISMKLPADWFRSGSSDKENTFRFVTVDNDGLALASASVSIYSLPSDMKSAEEWAKRDLKNNTDYINPKYVSASEVTSGNLFGKQTFEYTINYKDPVVTDQSVMRDIFFFSGDYCYNLSVTYYNPYKQGSTIAKSIVDSFTVTDISKDNIGELMFPDNYTLDEVEKITNKDNKLTVELPSAWKELSSSSATYIDTRYGVKFSAYSTLEKSITLADIRYTFSTIESKEKDLGCKILRSTYSLTVNTYGAAGLDILHQDDEDGVMVERLFAFTTNGRIYTINFMMPEMLYGGKMDDVVDRILKSFVANV